MGTTVIYVGAGALALIAVYVWTKGSSVKAYKESIAAQDARRSTQAPPAERTGAPAEQGNAT